MSREIPILHVTHGQAPGHWTLVPEGHLKPSAEHASPQATEDVFRMWNTSIESIICEEFPSFGLPQYPHDNERRNFISYAKENFRPKSMGLGLCADQSSGRVLNGLSPKKRGILTVNSGLCNGSEAAPKRQRQHEASCTKQSDVKPMFQTASMKPVQISSSAMQKAKVLLDFDDIGACTTHGKEKRPLNDSLHKVESTKRKCSGGFKRQSDNDAVGGSLEQSANASACLFQTATGKAVPISNAGMRRAMSLFGNTETSILAVNSNQISSATMDQASLRSGLDQDLYRNMLQTALGQPNLMSKIAVKQLAKISEKENLSFPLESPSSSSAKFALGQHGAEVSTCLFQTASGKAVSISSAGMHQAAALLGDTELSKLDINTGINLFQTARGQSVSVSSTAVKQASKLLGETNFSFPLESPSSSSSAKFALGQHGAEVSTCLFQTAGGKAVSISSAGMQQAAALLGDTEPSKLDIDTGINLFQTARGHSVSVSSTAVKQASKLLGEANFSFPVEAPLSSPPIRFVTGKGQCVSVSSSAIKRAKDLLGGELEDTDIIASAHLINGAEHNNQRLFETSEGHLIKVSNGSIQRARVLLKERALNTSVGPCPSRSHNLDINGGPSRKDLNALHSHAVQEPKFPPFNRKGSLPRKFVACFKAPRQLQPTMLPATTSNLKEDRPQLGKHNFSQLVNMDIRHRKEKQKISYKNFFKLQPHQDKELGHLSKEIVTMTSETAKTYKFISTVHGLESIGADEFRSMLLEVGANAQIVTKEWVDNHYRWIVWKLASLERSYPSQVANRLLTIQKVFDELRNRYEREVDRAHRSALKKVTEGDAAAGRMMVLCVAEVSFRDHTQTNLVEGCSTQLSEDSLPVQIELTDGWYSLMAHLDQPLVKQSLAGKLFVGQKLRVCRAALAGCTNPMPPLEAFHVMKLALHMNGTYRAHWMDKLGFCKGMPMPLAFHCIRPDGGLVPRTIIGIHRIYPILYYERLPNRGSITRSARAEDLAVRGYHDRRNQIAEEAVIRMEREHIPLLPENDVDEGAKLFQLLENSAEPELLMADMSAAQHASFAAYQAKREAARQSLTHKKVLKALGEVHLDSREVTPYVKLSVMGLSFLSEQAREYQTCGRSTKGGIVTIWQVTDEQVDSLKEGAVFCVSDLYPLYGRSSHQSRNGVLHLRATKATKWQLLSHATSSHFTPRQALQLSLLGTLPFRSEFDVAVLVVHVGKPYACGIHHRQWLFASDGSVEEEFCNEPQKLISLLAIDWSTLSEAFLPVERSLEGCIIGYCNLVKRSRDQRNCMWVAEASESCVFSSNLSSGNFAHLKAAADDVSKWAKSSGKLIEELEERIQVALVGGS